MLLKLSSALTTFLLTTTALASQPFCLQNFNVYGPIYAPAVTARTALITEQLKSENPRCDVLQFQEVWNRDHIDQVMQAFQNSYAISAPNLDSRIGVMSLFEGEIAAQETHLYQLNSQGGVLDTIRGWSGVKKAYHIVKAKLQSQSEEMYFLNTHMHPTSGSVRLAQIVDLYRWRLQHQDRKLVMSGDFNSEIGSLERALIMSLLGVHDSMEEVMGGTYPLNFCSYCEENPHSWLSGHHLFDYVFYSNVSESAESIHALRGEVNLKGQGRNTLSDHYGVRVYLSLDSLVPLTPSPELRRNKLVSILDKAIAQLRAEYSQEYADTIQQLEITRESLERRQGEDWEYFSQFR